MKIYEGEHHRRSIVSYPPDCHAARALKLRKSLPRLEMPCVRAATSSIGVRLDRLRVPRPIRRKIFALAFDLPDEEERLAETQRDEKFMEGFPKEWNVETPPADSDPPMVAGALEGATLDVTHHDEPKRILEYWCDDAHEREDRRKHAWPPHDFSSPLHDLRRSVVDAKRWAPGWKPQRWQEYYHTGPGFPEAEGPAQDPRLINEHSRPMSPMGDFSSDSDDEDIDEAVLADSDDEDDVSAELICRPRTIGGIPQTRE